MYSSVFAIYNTALKQVVMIVIDAQDINDPSFNPPDCIQVPVDAEIYNQLPTNEETYAFIQQCVDDVLARSS